MIDKQLIFAILIVFAIIFYKAAAMPIALSILLVILLTLAHVHSQSGSSFDWP
jgi:hypothetical protein